MVFMEGDRETLLFLIFVNSSLIWHQKALFYAQLFYQSALSLLNQVCKDYKPHVSELVGALDQNLAMGLPHMKSSTLSICTMLVRHSPLKRQSMHEAQAEPRNDSLVSWIPNHFSTPNVKAFGDTKVREDFPPSKTPVELDKRYLRSLSFVPK